MRPIIVTPASGRVTSDDATPAWERAIAALRMFRERRGTADVPVRIRAAGVDLGKWVARCRDAYWEGHLSSARIGALEAVDGWTWGPNRPGTWRDAFDAMARYCQLHGTTIIYDKYVTDGVDLHAWASTQRKQHAEGELTNGRIEHLERLADWEWDLDRARWRQGLAAAKRYAHGDSLSWARRDIHVGDFPLGQWVHRCREDYRAGTMAPERVAELESIPGWSWGTLQQRWRIGFDALQRYLAQTGHACPTQHTVFDGYPLGRWVAEKRRQYRNGTLPSHWATSLESLPGWEWDPLRTRWQQGLHFLTEYAAEYGHADPARGQSVGGFPVGDWVRAQRVAHDRDRGTLSPERAAQLEALPGWRWHSRKPD